MNKQEKVYKSVVAVIRIIDPKTEKVEAKHIKTIDGHERRNWIAKTVMYAIMNGKIAEVINKDDDKDE